MKPYLLLILLLISVQAWAGSTDDRVALGDLASLKIICDVNVGDAKLLLRRLELIDETYSQLLDEGVAATFVIAFRGGASRYVTTGDRYVDPADVTIKREIQGWIDQFQEHGFRLEQCAIAAKAWKVDPDHLLPAIRLVRNGYISIAAYQSRGYALLPMD